MKSLTYLNTRGQTSVSVTDNRPAGVIFNRVVPYQAVDQTNTISSTSPTINPGIEIVEIINGATANVRYRVEIVRGTASPLPTSSITFASLPTGVTQSIAGTVYTLSGIDSLSDWNTIKSFTWNLPADYASYPLWYLKVSVIYYDGATAADKTKSWLVYDDRFYYVAQLSTTATSTASVLKVKVASAAITEDASTVTATIGRRRSMNAAMSATASMTATGYVVLAFINVESSMSIAPVVKRSGAANISSTATVVANVGYKANPGATMSASASLSATPNELRFQIYHTTGRQDASYAISSYDSPSVTVYWGDGTNTVYTGTAGGYGNHTITHTYTGTGFKEIRVVAKQVVKLTTDGTTANCPYIYNVYDWGVQRISNSYLQSALQNQIYLESVPKVCPSLCVSLNSAFTGCTTFNDSNLTVWNTSSVTQMTYTFESCSAFNQPISTWNTSNVTTMQGMFTNATTFNRSLSVWNVGNVKNMASMFSGCTSFNQSIGDWTQSNCNMTSMFYKCTSFNQGNMYINLGTTGGDMSRMFYQCTSWSQENFNSTMIRIRNHVELGQGGFPTGITFGYPRTVELERSTVPGSPGSATIYLEGKGWTFVDESPGVQILDSTVSEGTPLDFTINIYEPDPGRTHTVNLRFSTLTGTAILNSDYTNILYADLALTQPLDLTPLPGPQYYKLDFEPGQTTKHVYIKTFNTANSHPCTVILQPEILDSNDAVALDLYAVGTINGV
jgi:surface protein